MSSFSHADTAAAETSCWYLTPGVYRGASTVRLGIPFSTPCNVRASPPTTTNPSFSFMGRSSFMWSAWSRSINFSLTAASDGRDWLLPMMMMGTELPDYRTALDQEIAMCCNLGKLWLPIKVLLVIALIGREQRVNGSRGSPTQIRWHERKVPASIPSTFDRRASKHDAYMRDTPTCAQLSMQMHVTHDC